MKPTRLLIALLATLAAGIALHAVLSESSGRDAPAQPGGSEGHVRNAASRVDTSVGFETVAEPLGTLRLEGLVVDEFDQPVSGARVVLDARPARIATTEADGSFLFTGLLGRSYMVEARGEHATAGPIAVRVTPLVEPVILHLARAQVLEVTVRSALSNQPIEHAVVEAIAVDTHRGTTGEDGLTELGPLAPGVYGVHVRAEGRTPWSGTIAIASGEGVTKHEVSLEDSEALAGTVSAGGRPVEGALVQVQHAAESTELAPPPLASVTTDGDGRWRLVDGPTGALRVVASHPRFAPSSPVLVEGGPREGIELTLGVAAVVRGRVVDAEGDAVAFATVRVAAAGDMSALERPLEATCGDDGAFAIGGLAPVLHLVVASHDGAASETAEIVPEPGVDVETTLVLSGEHAISGRVVDAEGEPRGATLVVVSPIESTRRSLIEYALRNAHADVSDFEGRFRITGLAPGRYRIAAVPPGTARVLPSLSERPFSLVTTGDENVELMVPADGRIAGRIVSESGAAISSIEVTIDGGHPIPTAVSDSAFAVDGVAPGKHRVVVSGDGFVPTRPLETNVRSDATTDLGVLRVASGRSVRGRVSDVDGSPVAGATVTIGARILSGTDLAGVDGAMVVRSTAGGRFEAVGLADGPLSIVAQHPSKGRSVPMALRAREGETSLDLRLVQTGSLRGQLRGAPRSDEQPVLAARLAGREDVTHTVVLERDGSWYLGNLVPGTWKVQVLLPEHAGVERVLNASAEVERGKTGRVDFEASLGNATVRVRVAGAQGGTVMVVALAGGDIRLVELGTETQATIPGLADGRYRVCFVAPDGGRPCEVVSVRADSSPHQVDLQVGATR